MGGIFKLVRRVDAADQRSRHRLCVGAPDFGMRRWREDSAVLAPTAMRRASTAPSLRNPALPDFALCPTLLSAARQKTENRGRGGRRHDGTAERTHLRARRAPAVDAPHRARVSACGCYLSLSCDGCARRGGGQVAARRGAQRDRSRHDRYRVHDDLTKLAAGAGRLWLSLSPCRLGDLSAFESRHSLGLWKSPPSAG